jgi:DNA polymerase/3'-5' exonuclease PolX
MSERLHYISTGSYMMAAKSVRSCKHAIKNAKDAEQLRGISDKIGEHVQELLDTGKIERLEELRAGKV